MRAALFGHASGEGDRELLRNIQQQLQALADRLHEKWREVCVTVKEGKPVDLIIAEAAERNADLVVMGAHGNHDLSRRLFGDTTYQVARRIPCSVMVFREQDAKIASLESPD